MNAKRRIIGEEIRECGGEVLYMMVRPGRPRKYQTAAPLENNTMSTPSTTAHNSAHGSDDEKEHTQRTQTLERSGDDNV